MVKTSRESFLKVQEVESDLDSISLIGETGMTATAVRDAVVKMGAVTSSAGEIDSLIGRDAQTACLIGDSLTNANYFEDSTTKDYRTSGYFTWVQCFSGHAFNVLNFAGISGQTSTQIVARIDADVIAYKPAWCFLLMGMNDIVTPEANTALKNNFIEAYNKLSVAGIKLVLLTMTAITADNGKNSQALMINQWMLDYFKDKKSVIVVDVGSETRNPTSSIGALKTNVSYDGVHNSTNGSFLIGKKVYNAVKPFIKENYKWLPKSVYDAIQFNTNSKNYFKYPLVTGTVTDGWVSSLPSYYRSINNATVTATVEPSLDGIGNSQVLDIVATGVANNVQLGNVILDFDCNISPLTIPAGKSFYATCQVEVDAGHTNIANICLMACSSYGANRSADLRSVNTPVHGLSSSEKLTLTLKTPITTYTSAITQAFNRVMILFAGAGNAKVRISKLAFVVLD